MEQLIAKLKLQIQILQIQLQIALLNKKLTIPNLPKPEGIVVHHGGGDWGFDEVNRHHTQKWGFISSLGYGLGYQYWIAFGGRRYQARQDNEEGAHTVGSIPKYYNRTHIGICCQGNTDLLDITPNQKIELKKLIDELKIKYDIPNEKIIGHREVSKTTCPGKFLSKWLVENYPSKANRNA